MKLYHASDISGIRRLEPRASTHGVPYVYAIEDKLTALLFGAPKDDFDILIMTDDGVTEVYECYPGAFEKVYKGKGCSLYEIDGAGFSPGVTSWDAEYVSESAAPVLFEYHIPDIYAELARYEESGELVVHGFSRDAEYLEFIKDELTARIRDFGMTDESMDKDPRFKLYLNEITGRRTSGSEG
ncbi:MAG: hypothetical protein IJS45_06815 [Clostridia bacterium]|nr:hypothetical protein [Clostridia bacterium]